MFLYIFLIVILLVFSAFFSSSETILYKVSEFDIEVSKNYGKRSRPKRADHIRVIKANEEEYLTFILFSNTIVNIVIDILCERLGHQYVFKGYPIIYFASREADE